jgi:hypothetical protein
LPPRVVRCRSSVAVAAKREDFTGGRVLSTHQLVANQLHESVDIITEKHLAKPAEDAHRRPASLSFRPLRGFRLDASGRNHIDIAHDAVTQDVARIAIVGDSCHSAIPKETFEASFERPIYIRVGGVVRIQELARDDINVAVGQQQHFSAGSRHVIILLGLSIRRIEATLIHRFDRRHASIGSKVITDRGPLSRVGPVATSPATDHQRGLCVVDTLVSQMQQLT